MAEQQDLYAVLGVAKDASEDEIRRAYRKLAREHHPDVNPGKPAAEEKFKQISAAYDVLSNKEKRALYDEFGTEGLRGGFDPEQARAYRKWSEGRRTTRGFEQAGGFEGEVPFEYDLGDLFGGRRPGRAQPWAAAGQDLSATVELDFKTSLSGTEVELRLPTRGPCEVCVGSGERPGSQAQTCPDCGGSGRKQVVQGPMRLMGVCPRCGGDGKIHDPCTACGGAGVVESVQDVRVRIPPGADDGSELRVRGKGAPGHFGGPPGDLILQTRVQPHPYFRRDGLDLHLKLPVTLAEAYVGASVSVPTLTGPVQTKIPPHSQQGAKLRLKGKGVKRGDKQGDLYVELDVRLPEVEDAQLTEALRASEHLYTRPVREGVEL